MTSQELNVEEVNNHQDLMAFIRFPWQIYQGDRNWVPPLIKDQLLSFSPNHPFRSHSEMILFMALQGGRIVGRIAGIIDHHYIEFQAGGVVSDFIGGQQFMTTGNLVAANPHIFSTMLEVVKKYLEGVN